MGDNPCEWNPDKYDPPCRNPARFYMRCQNSGFTYDVCGVHRLTALRIGDTVAGTITICPTCKRDGWVSRTALPRAEDTPAKATVGPNSIGS